MAELNTQLKDMSVDSKKRYERVRLEEISEEWLEKPIKTFGWVTKTTTLKSKCFFHLTSAFGTVKCIVEGKHNFTIQTSLTIWGVPVRPYNKRDDFNFEIVVDDYEVYNGALAPTFPLNEHSEKETILNNGHLGLRQSHRALFLKARDCLLQAVRSYYHETGYIEVTPPTLVQTQVEGGATLFSLDYYGEKAYLTQSSQLYLETVAPVAGKVFCIMPSYRAEKSKTSRHLSEFTHVEAELADLDFNELLEAIEGLFRHCVLKFYCKMLGDIKAIEPDFLPIQFTDTPFKRISYKEAIEFLYSKNHLKPDGTEYKYMDDIADASEKFICAEYGGGQPVFLTHFPFEMKSFYMKKLDNGLTESCDLLFPDVGETVGGSMRLDEYQKLEEAFRREGITPEPYYWYLDMARYGPFRHGGYGMGFERLLAGLMRYKNVDEACLYPRKVSRCRP